MKEKKGAKKGSEREEKVIFLISSKPPSHQLNKEGKQRGRKNQKKRLEGKGKKETHKYPSLLPGLGGAPPPPDPPLLLGVKGVLLLLLAIPGLGGGPPPPPGPDIVVSKKTQETTLDEEQPQTPNKQLLPPFVFDLMEKGKKEEEKTMKVCGKEPR